MPPLVPRFMASIAILISLIKAGHPAVPRPVPSDIPYRASRVNSQQRSQEILEGVSLQNIQVRLGLLVFPPLKITIDQDLTLSVKFLDGERARLGS